MINILISVNTAYLDKAKTMLFSLRRHTKGDITVYLLNHRLTVNELQDFERYLNQKCKMKLEVVDVSNTEMDDFPELSLSVEMYYRILAQFILPDSVDRILWLDADIIVLNDITEFYNTDFEDNAYVVCPDVADKLNWFQEVKIRLSLPQEYVYFNSGVMLMNLPWLRKNTSIESLLSHSKGMIDKLLFPDQDILNTYYQGKLKYADWKKYNYQVIYVNRIEKEELDNLAILHYCVKIKPWMYGYVTNINRHYFKVRFLQGHFREVFTVYARTLKQKLFRK